MLQVLQSYEHTYQRIFIYSSSLEVKPLNSYVVKLPKLDIDQMTWPIAFSDCCNKAEHATRCTSALTEYLNSTAKNETISLGKPYLPRLVKEVFDNVTSTFLVTHPDVDIWHLSLMSD